jgi:hypothetical protein
MQTFSKRNILCAEKAAKAAISVSLGAKVTSGYYLFGNLTPDEKVMKY